MPHLWNEKLNKRCGTYSSKHGTLTTGLLMGDPLVEFWADQEGWQQPISAIKSQVPRTAQEGRSGKTFYSKLFKYCNLQWIYWGQTRNWWVYGCMNYEPKSYINRWNSAIFRQRNISSWLLFDLSLFVKCFPVHHLHFRRTGRRAWQQSATTQAAYSSSNAVQVEIKRACVSNTHASASLTRAWDTRRKQIH